MTRFKIGLVVLLGGGLVGALTQIPNIYASFNQEVVEETIFDGDVNSEPIILPDEIPVAGDDVVVAPEPTPEPQPSPTVPSVTLPPYEAEESQSPSTTTYLYHTIGEFEQAVLGKCQKDIPENAWPDPVSPSVSIGILSSMTYGYGMYDSKGVILRVWNSMKGRGLAPSDHYYLGKANNLDKNIPKLVELYLNWSALEVTAEYPASVTSEDIALITALTSEMTYYLQYLDTTYNNKCL